jgi:hypothetical protein
MYQGGTASQAIAAALEYAEANGFDVDDGASVSVHIPPQSGEHVGDPNYVEVTVEETPESFFIHAVLPGGNAVKARGVAGFQLFPEPYAIVVLEDSECKAFDQQGNASISVDGGGIMVNSDCPTNAFSKTGSGSISASGSIDVHGGTSVSGSGTVSPEPNAAVPWGVSNPLAALDPPPRGAPAPGSPGTPQNPVTYTYSSGPDLTLYPGTYYGGFSSNCTCNIYLEPGIYVMAGGGFTKAGGANFIGDGVLIYVTTNPENPTGDGAAKPFDLSGTGDLDLSPMTTGDYHGITLWQDEQITDSFTMRGSNDLLAGLVYVPGATFDVSGNSVFDTVQLVVKKFLLSGNAPLNLTYGEYRTFEAPDVTLVE